MVCPMGKAQEQECAVPTAETRPAFSPVRHADRRYLMFNTYKMYDIKRVSRDAMLLHVAALLIDQQEPPSKLKKDGTQEKHPQKRSKAILLQL